MKNLPLFLLTSLLSLPLSANPLGYTLPQNLPMMELHLPKVNSRLDGTIYEQRGAEKIKYVYAGSQRVAQISSTQGTTYFTNDHQGSAALLTDTSGNQVQSTAYLPFGGTFQTAGSKTTSWRYTGQRQDDSTGLYYYNARYYDPTIGRFLTPDTIVQSPYDPQFLNRYAYCRNNPINLVDPTGHTAQQDDENEYGLYLDLTGTHQVTPEPPPTLDDERPRNNSGDQSRDDAFQSWLPGFLEGVNEYNRQAALKRQQEEQSAIARQKEFNFGHAGLKEGWMNDPGLGHADMDLWGLALIIHGGLSLAGSRLATLGEEGSVMLGVAAEGESGTALARSLGAEGEELAGITKNTERIESLSQPGSYRVPDVLNDEERIIGEVKNVSYQPFTRQLRDYSGWAEQNGYSFELYIRDSTRMSGPLNQAVNQGKIMIKYLLKK